MESTWRGAVLTHAKQECLIVAAVITFVEVDFRFAVSLCEAERNMFFVRSLESQRISCLVLAQRRAQKL